MPEKPGKILLEGETYVEGKKPSEVAEDSGTKVSTADTSSRKGGGEESQQTPSSSESTQGQSQGETTSASGDTSGEGASLEGSPEELMSWWREKVEPILAEVYAPKQLSQIAEQVYNAIVEAGFPLDVASRYKMYTMIVGRRYILSNIDKVYGEIDKWWRESVEPVLAKLYREEDLERIVKQVEDAIRGFLESLGFDSSWSSTVNEIVSRYVEKTRAKGEEWVKKNQEAMRLEQAEMLAEAGIPFIEASDFAPMIEKKQEALQASLQKKTMEAREEAEKQRREKQRENALQAIEEWFNKKVVDKARRVTRDEDIAVIAEQVYKECYRTLRANYFTEEEARRIAQQYADRARRIAEASVAGYDKFISAVEGLLKSIAEKYRGRVASVWDKPRRIAQLVEEAKSELRRGITELAGQYNIHSSVLERVLETYLQTLDNYLSTTVVAYGEERSRKEEARRKLEAVFEALRQGAIRLDEAIEEIKRLAGILGYSSDVVARLINDARRIAQASLWSRSLGVEDSITREAEKKDYQEFLTAMVSRAVALQDPSVIESAVERVARELGLSEKEKSDLKWQAMNAYNDAIARLTRDYLSLVETYRRLLGELRKLQRGEATDLPKAYQWIFEDTLAEFISRIEERASQVMNSDMPVAKKLATMQAIISEMSHMVNQVYSMQHSLSASQKLALGAEAVRAKAINLLESTIESLDRKIKEAVDNRFIESYLRALLTAGMMEASKAVGAGLEVALSGARMAGLLGMALEAEDKGEFVSSLASAIGDIPSSIVETFKGAQEGDIESSITMGYELGGLAGEIATGLLLAGAPATSLAGRVAKGVAKTLTGEAIEDIVGEALAKGTTRVLKAFFRPVAKETAEEVVEAGGKKWLVSVEKGELLETTPAMQVTVPAYEKAVVKTVPEAQTIYVGEKAVAPQKKAFTLWSTPFEETEDVLSLATRGGETLGSLLEELKRYGLADHPALAEALEKLGMTLEDLGAGRKFYASVEEMFTPSTVEGLGVAVRKGSSEALGEIGLSAVAEEKPSRSTIDTMVSRWIREEGERIAGGLRDIESEIVWGTVRLPTEAVENLVSRIKMFMKKGDNVGLAYATKELEDILSATRLRKPNIADFPREVRELLATEKARHAAISKLLDEASDVERVLRSISEEYGIPLEDVERAYREALESLELEEGVSAVVQPALSRELSEKLLAMYGSVSLDDVLSLLRSYRETGRRTYLLQALEKLEEILGAGGYAPRSGEALARIRSLVESISEPRRMRVRPGFEEAVGLGASRRGRRVYVTYRGGTGLGRDLFIVEMKPFRKPKYIRISMREIAEEKPTRIGVRAGGREAVEGSARGAQQPGIPQAGAGEGLGRRAGGEAVEEVPSGGRASGGQSTVLVQEAEQATKQSVEPLAETVELLVPVGEQAVRSAVRSAGRAVATTAPLVLAPLVTMYGAGVALPEYLQRLGGRLGAGVGAITHPGVGEAYSTVVVPEHRVVVQPVAPVIGFYPSTGLERVLPRVVPRLPSIGRVELVVPQRGIVYPPATVSEIDLGTLQDILPELGSIIVPAVDRLGDLEIVLPDIVPPGVTPIRRPKVDLTVPELEDIQVPPAGPISVLEEIAEPTVVPQPPDVITTIPPITITTNIPPINIDDFEDIPVPNIQPPPLPPGGAPLPPGRSRARGRRRARKRGGREMLGVRF